MREGITFTSIIASKKSSLLLFYDDYMCGKTSRGVSQQSSSMVEKPPENAYGLKTEIAELFPCSVTEI